MFTHETHHVRDTSREAYQDIALPAQERFIVDYMLASGPRDWSIQELSRAMPTVNLRSVGARLFDLKAKRVVFERRVRTCDITGNNIHAVALREHYPHEFDAKQSRRIETLQTALDNAPRCDCDCCKRWREKFRQALA